MSPAPLSPASQEEDRISGRGSALVIAALIAVILALCAWSWVVLRPHLSRADPRPPATEVGIVEQTLVNVDTTAYAIAARKRAILESYGWLSHPAGIARIPIEEAMKIVAGGGG